MQLSLINRKKRKKRTKCDQWIKPGLEQKSVGRVIRRCSLNKVFKTIVLNSQETPVLESLFNQVSVLQTCNSVKKWLQERCFPVNFVRFLRTPILQNSYEQLLLHLLCIMRIFSFVKSVERRRKSIKIIWG